MEGPGQTLGQYGAVGAVLVILLGLFLWSFRKLFDRLIGHMDAFSRFMEETGKAFVRLTAEISKHHEESVERHRDLMSHLRDKEVTPLPRPVRPTRGGGGEGGR